jgi:hypothetical protein
MAATQTDRIDELVQKVRTCTPQERRNAAFELAATESEAAVKELIRMVEARSRGWLSHHDLQDQLIGVEALGKTGSLAALDYLRQVYESSRCFQQTKTEVMSEGSEPRDDNVYAIEFDVHVYPLARSDLAARLEYKHATAVTEQYYGAIEPESWPGCATVEDPEYIEVHLVFRRASSMLVEQQGSRSA